MVGISAVGTSVPRPSAHPCTGEAHQSAVPFWGAPMQDFGPFLRSALMCSAHFYNVDAHSTTRDALSLHVSSCLLLSVPAQPALPVISKGVALLERFSVCVDEGQR